MIYVVFGAFFMLGFMLHNPICFIAKRIFKRK